LPSAAAAENRYIYVRGKLVAVPMNPAKLFTAGLLPPLHLARLLAEPFVSRRSNNGRDESIADFARRRVGKAAAEVLVDGHPEIGLLRPLARLGRRQWSTIGEVREIGRIRYEDWDRGGEG